MRFQYDMAAVSPERRLRCFREMVAAANGENAVGYEFGSADFTAKVRGRSSGDFLLAATTTSSHSLRFNSGSRLEAIQGRGEARRGDAGFISQANPFRSISGGIGHRIYMYVPKRSLVERLGAVDDLTARDFSSKLTAQGLATRYFARPT